MPQCYLETNCGCVSKYPDLVADFNSQEKVFHWKSDETVSYAPGPFVRELYRHDVLETISATIDKLQSELRDISLRIHANPELGFEEKLAHGILTDFMESQGFVVTRHYLEMDTAWRAAFTHSHCGRVIGINCEMDALPGIGHACGHNLIAIAGVAVAVAIKAALVQHDIPGTVVALGTPAEETGGGKIILLERGAYKEMDACIMCHPFQGPINAVGVGTCSTRQTLEVEYCGRGAHAAQAPSDGRNALDAAFLAYSGLSTLRQQMEPGLLSHGSVYGKDWSPNVIPDYAKIMWMIRGRTSKQVAMFREKVKKCFQGAAMQADCTVKIVEGHVWNELRQNSALANEFARNSEQGFGMNILSANESRFGASTDFGSVSYALPSIHPVYAIPTEPAGGNHTLAFAHSAQTETAHLATLTCAKALAQTGFRLLDDPIFFEEVKSAFERDKLSMAT